MRTAAVDRPPRHPDCRSTTWSPTHRHTSNYGYGVADPNQYIGSGPVAALFAQYATKRAIDLKGGAGALTDGKASHDLGTSCAAGYLESHPAAPAHLGLPSEPFKATARGHPP